MAGSCVGVTFSGYPAIVLDHGGSVAADLPNDARGCDLAKLYRSTGCRRARIADFLHVAFI
jgi:hypothetical protein